MAAPLPNIVLSSPQVPSSFAFPVTPTPPLNGSVRPPSALYGREPRWASLPPASLHRLRNARGKLLVAPREPERSKASSDTPVEDPRKLLSQHSMSRGWPRTSPDPQIIRRALTRATSANQTQ
eukprot:GEMP01052703.1.p3 GENE.GEMP01052703.1~~GEMP01052703.1.p3  ORF type:complete len:123 (-),score=18.04 GEMP01052703.1:249-617(-)